MTSIEWTDETWNPVRGCSKVSPGCTNCYAERTAARQVRTGYKGLVVVGNGSPRWTGKVRFVAEKLGEPLGWKKPKHVFVNSMSDLFHEALTNEEIAAVFAVMSLSPTTTFQVLTKRAERMREWFVWAAEQDAGSGHKSPAAAMWNALTEGPGVDVHRPKCALLRDDGSGVWCDCDIGPDNEMGPTITDVWPLPNVWLGVSVEDQQRADERIPPLLETPAAVRFLSVEPLLEPVDLRRIGKTTRGNDITLGGSVTRYGYKPRNDAECAIAVETTIGELPALDWVIVGGESGPGSRPCDIAWVRSIVGQCKAAGVACFVKQLGAVPVEANIHSEEHPLRGHLSDGVVRIKSRKGGDPLEWPADLRVREFPKARTA